MLLPTPVVPLNEPQVHFQGLLCQVSPEPVDVLLITPPSTFYVLCMGTSPRVDKIPLVVDLVVDVAILGQSVIRAPTITYDLTTRSNIFGNDWA